MWGEYMSNELTEKQIVEIEKIIGRPFPFRKPNPIFNNLPKDIQHQIDKVLNTDMKYTPEDAVRVVRSYLNDRKHKS